MAGSETLTAEDFGGYPFLDTNFQPGRLLVAVACVRWARREGAGNMPTQSELQQVLEPEVAVAIRRLDLELDLPSRALDLDQERRARTCVDELKLLIPAWRRLLTIPITFRLLIDRPSISASSFALPQHIFLAEAAFLSASTLAEQIVHELSHQWVYFIEELEPLIHAGSDLEVTLPSGTSGRSASELLGALHVTTSLNRLWDRLPVSAPDRTTRLSKLRSYANGCVALLDEVRPCFTTLGLDFAARLTEEVGTWN